MVGPEAEKERKVTICAKVIQFHNPCNDHTPHFFELASEPIKLSAHSGDYVVEPEVQKAGNGTFTFEKLTRESDERFAIGLEIRANDKPLSLVNEKYLPAVEEVNSYGQNNTFGYEGGVHEVTLRDKSGAAYKVRFELSPSAAPPNRNNQSECPERAGKRLLVGRFANHKGKMVYVKNIAADRRVAVIEPGSKLDYVIQLPDKDF